MKKKSFVIVLVLLGLIIPIQTGKAQILDGLGAANSTNAANTTVMVTQLATLTTIIEKMGKAQEVVKKSLKFVEKAEELQRAARLIELIDATICSMQEYQFYLQFGIKYDCIIQFEYELINSKFSYTTNIINAAVTASNLLTSGDRVKSVKDAIEMLEGAMQKTEAFNDKMSKQVNVMLVNKYINAQSKGLATLSRY